MIPLNSTVYQLEIQKVISGPFKLGGVSGWVGGFHPNNQPTLWPNLQAEDKQDFNSS